MTLDSTPAGRVDIGILTVIPPEFHAVEDALGRLERFKESPNDTIYLRGTVRSELRGCDYSVVLASIGSAGNSSASALATQMIERFRPSVVLLVGIAAGMRGKPRCDGELSGGLRVRPWPRGVAGTLWHGGRQKASELSRRLSYGEGRCAMRE